jgi:hypothetical protein
MDWFIDLRAHAHGGPVGTLKITDGQGGLYETADLVAAMQGRDVLLMAHGYNVNRPNGELALNNFKSALVDPAPLFIGVLWPGDCVLPIFIDYVWEGGEANKSGDLLGAFVNSNFSGAASVSFASHSLGARLVLRALVALQDPMRVRQLILLAAAVEDDSLTNSFVAAADRVDHISVVYSMEDDVLKMAYPAGNLLGFIANHDTPNVKAALGRLGPLAARPNIWTTGKLPDVWNFGHLDYLSETKLAGSFVQPVNVYDSDSTDTEPQPFPSELTPENWKPCWSPAFVSTRLQRL